MVGENILVELRYPEGRTDRIPSLVTELVQLKVDLLVLGASGRKYHGAYQTDPRAKRKTAGIA